MPHSGYDVDAIAADAERYMTQTLEELEYDFRRAWLRARESAPLPHRGDDSFWQNTRKRLAKEVVKNETTGHVSIVAVATAVVGWLQSSTIDLTSIEFPVGIFVAMVAKSAIDELRARNKKNKTKDTEKNT